MIYYDNVKLWTVHTKETEFNQKTRKHKKLKTPVVTEKVHMSDVHAYDLGELYDLIKFATERDPYNKIYVSLTVRTEY